MDAPTYPPAIAFEQPVAAPFELSTRTVSIGELMKMPAAWAIVTEHLPMMKMAVSAPQAKPHLGNMTVVDFAGFGGKVDSAALAAIDEAFRHLPPSEKSAQ